MYKNIAFLLIIVATTLGHEGVKPLSNEKHYNDDDDDGNLDHNDEYDHEAFLGRDEAREFDQLAPEESMRRLGLIVDRIDKDKDNFVSEQELVEWIEYTQSRYITEDVDRQWETHGKVSYDEHLSWDEYKKTQYGYDPDEEIDEVDEDDGFSYKEMLDRDKRRWDMADVDKDGQLSKKEFTDFIHPEDADHMKELVALETMEDIDKDKDGFISLDEYIHDMFDPTDETIEPEWVQNEREAFEKDRDKNGDGKMDLEELKDWILPSDYDHPKAEAEHLILSADEDSDGRLTKEEILKNHDLFAGSQATDYGEVLLRHDEF